MKRSAQNPPSVDRRKVQYISCPCCEARLALHFVHGEDEVYDVELLTKGESSQPADIAKDNNNKGCAAELPGAHHNSHGDIEVSRQIQPLSDVQPKKEASQDSKLFPLFYRPKKTVHLVRHGQTSMWEVPEVATDVDYRYDLRLTPLGRQQASSLVSKMASLKPDLILVSPLSRALETLQGAFPFAQEGKEQVEVTALHTEHVSCSGDIGRPPQVLAKEYPWLSFVSLPEVWWYSHPNFPNNAMKAEFNSVEPMEDLRKRVGVFRQFLRSRQENVIIIIGHSTFLRSLRAPANA